MAQSKHVKHAPQLRSNVAFGGTGLLALAVVASVGFIWNISKNDQLHAQVIAAQETQEELAAPHRSGELVVGYKPAANDKLKQDYIARNSGHLKRRDAKLNSDVVTVPAGGEAAALKALKTSPGIAYAEPNYERHALGTVTPADPGYAKQWGFPDAGFDVAWGTTTGAGAPLIGQIDTGVDMTHPDLLANIAPGGKDFVNNDNDPSDDAGHGTSTFGIIAALANNSLGGVGGCWSCKIIPVKVLDSTGSGTTANVASGITYLVDHGVKIINSSLGGNHSSSVEASAIAYAIGKGVIFIGAACENQPTNPPESFPGSYPGVIGVGATSKTGTLEAWSCFGSYVKISAPSSAYTTTFHGGFAPAFTGTSAAAPFVTAAVALLWAAHPAATRNQILAALLSGVDPCCSTTSGGKLNAGKSMAALASSLPIVKKGDMNGDTLVNVFDISYFLTKWASSDTKADINGDGQVNVFDLSALLANWSP